MRVGAILEQPDQRIREKLNDLRRVNNWILLPPLYFNALELIILLNVY